MKGSTYKRCGCKHPGTGKPLNQHCPDLSRRRHGAWVMDCRIDTTTRDGHRLQRSGFETQTKAQQALDGIKELVNLSGGDAGLRRRIGDLILTRSRYGGQLPDVHEVRRKLGAGADLAAPDATVGDWLEEWFAGKRGRKRSTKKSYRQHLDHYLIPLLGNIPRDKLRVEHISGLFDTIEEWNAEILAAEEEDRTPRLPDDKRQLHRVVGVATQHRILATLKNAYNVAVRRPGMIDWNPCLAIELPPERRDPARVWSPEQVATFLHATAEDRLGLLYRIILLRGPRRGEACGLRWEDLDLDHTQGKECGRAAIVQTILQISGQIVVDTPKTQAGERFVSLDAGTVKAFPAVAARQRRERFAAGEAYTDLGLVFCREDGSPVPPDTVSHRFKALAAAAGLPVIKLHEARHTAASLALEAGVDLKVVSDQLGHSKLAITADLYAHVSKAVHDRTAEQVVALLPDRPDVGGAL